MKGVNSTESSSKYLKMVGFAQWKWQFLLTKQEFELRFSWILATSVGKFGWGNQDEVSLQCRSPYTNTHSCLHLYTNVTIHGKGLLNGRKQNYYHLMAKCMNGSVLKSIQDLRHQK